MTLFRRIYYNNNKLKVGAKTCTALSKRFVENEHEVMWDKLLIQNFCEKEPNSFYRVLD